jgi:hypothetical protein
MTKAKEALEWYDKFNNQQWETLTLNLDVQETIREALELLDKVQRGGVSLRNTHIPYDPNSEGQSVVNYITDKYILIERKDYDRE